MPLARVRIVDDEGRDVPEATPGELADRADQVFAGYKRPRRWVVVDAPPKTPAGKIQKAELRRRLLEGGLAPLADVPLQGTR